MLLRPLEAGRRWRCGKHGRHANDKHGIVDNRIRPGQTVPLKLRVTCDNIFDPNATVTLDQVVRIDGSGTPIGNDLLEGDDGPCDDGNVFRLDRRGQSYRYNLSTKGWPTKRGARFLVTVRVAKEGHIDALCETILRNK